MTFHALEKKCQTPAHFTTYENYYYGETHLDALGVSLPPEIRLLEMSSMWPKLAVDVLVESLVLEGFSLADGEVPASLQRHLQRNNFDTLWPLAMTEALVQGQSFVIVGPGVDGPRITAHSARNFSVRRDESGRIVEAVRKYRVSGVESATYYEPGKFTTYSLVAGLWRKTGGASFRDPLLMPVVEVTNRSRLGHAGLSEIQMVAKLCDAASRTLTNLQVAQELLAFPVRYLFSDDATETLVDANGKQISKFEAYIGRFVTGPQGSSAGSIPGADLTQIISTFKLYAQQVSALTGIPPFMMGISADSNPASAEAMRSAKDRLVTRAMVKQSQFGDAAEDIARLVLAIAGESTDGLETLEARWRDPATASISSRNALILQAQAQNVISADTARKYLGLSPEELARENALDINARAVTGV